MRLRFFVMTGVLVAALFAAPAVGARAALPAAVVQTGEYEGRSITDVRIVIEGPARDPSNPCEPTTTTTATTANAAAHSQNTTATTPALSDQAVESELLSLLRVSPNSTYSAVHVRESLEALFREGSVACARVEVSEVSGAGGPLRLSFIVRRQVRVGEVILDLGVLPQGAPISEDELRARLNMLDPGERVTVQTLRSNADLIQAYLRDRGFYRAEVDYTQELDASGTRAAITYRIVPGEQATVSAFNIDIKGFDANTVRPTLKLQPGSPFTREALGEDLNRIRQGVIKQGNLAPLLEDPQVSLDSAGNLVQINLKGVIGPKVLVTLTDYDLREKTRRELLPILREGTIDWSAIIEGARRLRNRLQQDGWFFADVEAVCTVTPKPANNDAQNGTPEMCQNLNPSELSGSTVNIVYDVERGRRFKLTDIRITGTDQLTLEDVEDDLRTQKANVLGFIPLLGYGRGYTSRERLEEDRRLIEARMRDLGYRRAHVEVRQGVSLEGENLIITFAVTEGPLTRVAGVEFRGNQIYTEGRLRDEINSSQCRERLRSKDPDTNARLHEQFRTVIGAPFSRTGARADGDCILNLYARDGYIDAQLDFSIVELPRKGEDEQVRLVYTISNEGDKVFINRIFVNGNILTRREAILKTVTLVEGEVLRADRITESERLLYATDAFRQVIIRTENAGETAAGFKKRDVIIDVEETRPRILDYGGGFSTDNGPLGFIELRNSNLFGQLRQGAVRLRASRNQQLLRFEYFDPQFRQYGEGSSDTRRFMPLSLSLQYQRDSTVTRFFRSTIDRGNDGIVQRLDENGNPIDEFGNPAGEPTINRFTFNAETQRIISRDTRSTLFLRYNYEDVRLFNINSLLIEPILRPDRAIRISRVAATFVRDTRDSQFDATRGEYLTVDYALALRELGGNISFNKLQLNYRRYYKLGERLRRSTVLAGNITLGLANLFNPRDRNDNGVIDEVDRTLPISERFFSGGSTTLRGFGYEEAGPRSVIQGGIFRNEKGEPVTLQPFLVPIGGNALAVVNLEARTPLTKVFQVVPFYDGGNAFIRIGDIFGHELKPGEDPNLHVKWTHTVGLGLRIKTPLGGALAIDYGYLLNPSEFLLDPLATDPQVIRLKHGQLHFRFTQTF